MNPNILVTGSSGFIGGRLVDAFVDRYHVFAALRQGKSTLLDTKDASSVSYEDINSLSNKNFKAIIHCASLTPANCTCLDTIYQQNLSLTDIISSSIYHLRPEVFIFCSSVSVYGDVNGGILYPDSPYLNPGIYGQTKLDAENLFSKVCADLDIPCVHLRLPGVVGYGSHGNIISKIIHHFSTSSNETLALRNPDSLFNNIVPIPLLIDFVDLLLNQSSNNLQSFSTIPSAADPIPFRDVVQRLHSLFGISSTNNVVWKDSNDCSFFINCPDIFSHGYPKVSTIDIPSLLKLDIHQFTS